MSTISFVDTMPDHLDRLKMGLPDAYTESTTTPMIGFFYIYAKQPLALNNHIKYYCGHAKDPTCVIRRRCRCDGFRYFPRTRDNPARAPPRAARAQQAPGPAAQDPLRAG